MNDVNVVQHRDFVPDEFGTAKNLEELMEHEASFSGFEVDSIDPRDPDTVELNPQDMTLRLGTETRKIGLHGFQNLCRGLRIPDPFAKRIPKDLLAENIRRLAAQKEALYMFTKPDVDHWVNVSTYSLGGLNIPQFVNGFVEETGGDSVDIEYGHTGIELNVLFDTIEEGELKLKTPVELDREVGDITRFGWRVQLSESGFGVPSGQLVAYRLVCTNGMIAPRGFAKVKMRRTGDLEAAGATFIRRIRSLMPRVLGLSQQWKKVGTDDSGPDNSQFMKVWRGARKVVGDAEDTDEFLNVDTDVRKSIASAVKAANDFDADVEEIEDPIYKVSWYTLMNRVSRTANDFHGNPRRKLQSMSGRILQMAIS